MYSRNGVSACAPIELSRTPRTLLDRKADSRADFLGFLRFYKRGCGTVVTVHLLLVLGCVGQPLTCEERRAWLFRFEILSVRGKRLAISSRRQATATSNKTDSTRNSGRLGEDLEPVETPERAVP